MEPTTSARRGRAQKWFTEEQRGLLLDVGAVCLQPLRQWPPRVLNIFFGSWQFWTQQSVEMVRGRHVWNRTSAFVGREECHRTRS